MFKKYENLIMQMEHKDVIQWMNEIVTQFGKELKIKHRPASL